MPFVTFERADVKNDILVLGFEKATFGKPRILHSSDFVVKLILQIDLQMRPIKAVFAFEENHVIFTFPSIVLFYVALKHCHYSNYLQVFNSVIAASSFFCCENAAAAVILPKPFFAFILKVKTYGSNRKREVEKVHFIEVLLKVLKGLIL